MLVDQERLAQKEQIESAALLLRRVTSDAEMNGMLRESTALDYIEVINNIERDLVAYSLKEYNAELNRARNEHRAT